MAKRKVKNDLRGSIYKNGNRWCPRGTVQKSLLKTGKPAIVRQPPRQQSQG